MYFFLSADELNFWLETIRCFGAYYSIIPSVFIVGTHTDKFKVRFISCFNVDRIQTTKIEQILKTYRTLVSFFFKLYKKMQLEHIKKSILCSVILNKKCFSITINTSNSHDLEVNITISSLID